MFTDLRPVQMHHVTGRFANGAYLDTDLKIPLSHRQHVLEHQGWRAIGIGDVEPGNPFVLRLRRTGHLLIRLGDHHGCGVIALPAPTARQLGLMFHRIADKWGSS